MGLGQFKRWVSESLKIKTHLNFKVPIKNRNTEGDKGIKEEKVEGKKTQRSIVHIAEAGRESGQELRINKLEWYSIKVEALDSSVLSLRGWSDRSAAFEANKRKYCVYLCAACMLQEQDCGSAGFCQQSSSVRVSSMIFTCHASIH